jgi:hypothetical protein
VQESIGEDPDLKTRINRLRGMLETFISAPVRVERISSSGK